MTGNMQMMMKFRDLQVAEDFSKMAELGYLDKEFTMYGAAFWQKEKRHYIVTGDLDKLYDFDSLCAEEQTYLTPLLTLTKVCPVPSGCDDDIARTVKVDLAKKLAEVYSEAFFAAVAALSQAAQATNAAKPLFDAWQERLEGIFVEEKLQLFEGLARYAFSHRILTEEAYRGCQGWLRQTRREMEDDVVVKDLFERTFYGYAQWTEGQSPRYITNANKGSVYRKWRQAQLEGRDVTPIFAKTYWYNYTYTVNDARDAFKAAIQTSLGPDYLALAQKLSRLSSGLTIEAYDEVAQAVCRQCPPEAQQAFAALGRQWGVYK